MTKQDYIALDNKVAELYGIDACTEEFVEATTIFAYDKFVKTWLHQDWSRLMPLAIEHEISLYLDSVDACMAVREVRPSEVIVEASEYKDHPTKDIAVAVAIERALVAKKESEL